MSLTEEVLPSRYLFVYGTLMHPPIRKRVLGKDLESHWAVLPGFARYYVRGAVYPGICRKKEAQVQGLLLGPLAEGDFLLLDRFEGEEYTRARLTIRIESKSLTSLVYLYRQEFCDQLSSQSWNLNDFLDKGYERFFLR